MVAVAVHHGKGGQGDLEPGAVNSISNLARDASTEAEAMAEAGAGGAGTMFPSARISASVCKILTQKCCRAVEGPSCTNPLRATARPADPTHYTGPTHSHLALEH